MRRYRRSRDFVPAIAVVLFNEYWIFQQPKCYLKPKGVDHLGPLLPLLKEVAETQGTGRREKIS
jgi:hypothetical protein